MNDKNPDLSNAPRNYDGFKAGLRAYISFLGLKFIDAHNIPATGAAIIAANHLTNLDPFAVGQPTPRRVHFMSKIENFRTPLTRWIQYSGNAFPVDRSKADLGAIRTALRILKGGQLLVLFPQGHRGGDDARGGVAYLALKSGALIVPTGITMKPNWFGFLGGKRYLIKYGPPIKPEGTAEELTERMMDAIEALLDPPET